MNGSISKTTVGIPRPTIVQGTWQMLWMLLRIGLHNCADNNNKNRKTERFYRPMDIFDAASLRSVSSDIIDISLLKCRAALCFDTLVFSPIDMPVEKRDPSENSDIASASSPAAATSSPIVAG
mmetsp:Transcript_2177/g.5001  ORF Transcript_2177/g.5001 Transcript_2177/m.5001 type:complete len:123 (+) Transcript_2177:73-441(+)